MSSFTCYWCIYRNGVLIQVILNRMLLWSIVTLVFVMISSVVWYKYFPQLGQAIYIPQIYFVLQMFSLISMWFLPTVIVMKYKEIENRSFIISLSLLLPVVGGMFSYFLLRKYFSLKIKGS